MENEDIFNTKVKLKNFKCFGEEVQGFEEIYPINIVIGKNNSGKSALLDGIKYLISPFDISDLGHKKKPPEIFYTIPLNENEISTVFLKTTSGGHIKGNHFEYGMAWNNKPITIKLYPNSQKEVVHIEPKPDDNIKINFIDPISKSIRNPFMGKSFRFLSAERDITPESDEDKSLVLQSTGVGATTCIRRFITDNSLDRTVVEKEMLTALNEIFEPDATFLRIMTEKYTPQRTWEVFLEEEDKGGISLSNSGSGLKTIILVLLNLILIPVLENPNKHKEPNYSSYIFAFEELENNLHPGLQRRLLSFLQKYVEEKECLLFLTTHSNVVIDMFGKNKNAQIIHVEQNNSTATAKRVKTYIENVGIIDDLDVRASDILQSNCLIWVEGPSDRLLIKKWIDIESSGAIKEGTHYQCLMYGGKLLNHLTADEKTNEEAIDILKINNNAIVVMDRDRSDGKQDVNDTKKRIIKEVTDMGGYTWVTAGREIENYIPQEAINKHYEKKLAALTKYQRFGDYLNKTIGTAEEKRFTRSKVAFADKFSNFITETNMDVHELSSEIQKIVKHIRKWNKIS